MRAIKGFKVKSRIIFKGISTLKRKSLIGIIFKLIKKEIKKSANKFICKKFR